jgi:seryl-tRNA synthetase
MHNLEKLLANLPEAQAKLDRRGNGYKIPSELGEIDEMRRTLAREVGDLRFVFKQKSEEIGRKKREKTHNNEEMELALEAQRELRQTIQDKESELTRLEQLENQILLGIPNFPADHAPDGKDDSDNPVLGVWGKKPELGNFPPTDHVTLAERLGILDIERGTKIAGPRFSTLRGAGSRLQRAVINFMLDTHSSNGYQEITVPYLVNRATMTGTGQLPKFEFDLFKTEVGGNEMFLIPTSEVPVTNLHAGEVLSAQDLPIKYCCYSENFRAEAGASGKDTRGILRQHQFPKVEMVEFVKPEISWDELEKLKINAESILQKLGLHYRFVALSTGDLGFASKFTYDLEVWLPGQDKYREISSCSNYEDFQARRANIRYKDAETGKKDFIHTLNGSGLAVGRTIIAILEQGQQADGSVVIPEALHKYTGFSVIHPGGKTE